MRRPREQARPVEAWPVSAPVDLSTQCLCESVVVVDAAVVAGAVDAGAVVCTAAAAAVAAVVVSQLCVPNVATVD